MLPEVGVVLDAGTAMYRTREYLTTDWLDIFLTHTHLDHVIGLTYLFDVLAGRTMTRVAVHAEAEKLRAIDTHLFAQPLFPVKPPATFCPLTDQVSVAGDGRVTHFQLNHPGGAVGFRLDWPAQSMAYVSDTTASIDSTYVDRIRGVDLLVHECHFRDTMAERAALTGHSCTTQVAQVARQAEVGKLVLVHINPLETADDPVDLAAARAVFPRTELGTDRLAVEF